jgi:hypothetical protein
MTEQWERTRRRCKVRESHFTQEFKTSDNLLEQLVSERRQEVEALQRRDAEQAKELNDRGARRLKALQGALGDETSNTLKALEKLDAEESRQAAARLEKIRKDLSAAGVSAAPPKDHPGFVYSHLAAPHTSGWITPYYATLHGSNGAVWWQGYNPGAFDLGDQASGGGSGIFGTGAASFTTYLDWWFYFRPESTHFFGHNIYVPFNGFYIIYADDGFWDSKEAAARIDLSAQGYQYGYKPQASNSLFNVDSQNINVNDRFDGWRTMYYGDLLAGGDIAYLRVSASFYVYARGGGSHAEWDFSSGAANYIGMPWVYFS